MRKVFAVHTKIMLGGEYNRFNVELFADDEFGVRGARNRAAKLVAELSEEYAIELADDPSCVKVYILEFPIN